MQSDRDLWLRHRWTSRTCDVGADDLANEVFDKLGPGGRFMTAWEEGPRLVMGPLLLLEKVGH